MVAVGRRVRISRERAAGHCRVRAGVGAPTALHYADHALGVSALFTEAARFRSGSTWRRPGRADHHPRRNSGFEHPRKANWPMFWPIVNFRFGGNCGLYRLPVPVVRPRGKPCCHRLQSAESGHPLDENRVDCDRLLMHKAGLTVKFQSSWMDRHDRRTGHNVLDLQDRQRGVQPSEGREVVEHRFDRGIDHLIRLIAG
jgi:hypothetical protein